ncbi:hypothetical protein BDK51DRAFT_46652 [Blyttiomyces helicus]|uniref:Uncharacterized protein n=1 Tax=Blyttiomyces helicus TaxID=388810 RepID=A0A4V1IQL5_9FUNG|nr:hypothetical protein BDK51DRAFT_46652 [Blyttiomyces helicus]|eukprot:RKO86977.1 hypothetical protein BDK51DRAFT_46652 [Blyttiomyces helicus]
MKLQQTLHAAPQSLHRTTSPPDPGAGGVLLSISTYLLEDGTFCDFTWVSLPHAGLGIYSYGRNVMPSGAPTLALGEDEGEEDVGDVPRRVYVPLDGAAGHGAHADIPRGGAAAGATLGVSVPVARSDHFVFGIAPVRKAPGLRLRARDDGGEGVPHLLTGQNSIPRARVTCWRPPLIYDVDPGLDDRKLAAPGLGYLRYLPLRPWVSGYSPSCREPFGAGGTPSMKTRTTVEREGGEESGVSDVEDDRSGEYESPDEESQAQMQMDEDDLYS